MSVSPTRFWCAGLLVLAPIGLAGADEPVKPAPPTAQPAAEEPGVNLLEAAKAGSVAVEAEGTGDGRMNLKVTNLTGRRLKVVLPPGLVASGVSGQMGGMGGMGGGGMGGGGMGGGMGGGGMGGGGMGGGGGGMGGRGGGGGGGQMLTMPPTMGLMLVGRLIMSLVEPTESWNPASLMQGMMGMMGGGMGGMGGGMGGMGGGMGGMGGGMRSVPPTDLPNATLAPGQSRDLATRVVSLAGPDDEGGVRLPAKGEPLTIGDVAETDASPRVREALRRLARDKAPETVSQLALWGAGGMAWGDVARLSKGWANPQELALARQLVADLDAKASAGDTGRLLVEVKARDEAQKGLAAELSGLFRGRTMLGLAVEGVVPARPSGPAVACRVQLTGPSEASVQVATTDAAGTSWSAIGKFGLAVGRDEAGKVRAEAFGDALAEELLNRLVKVSLRKASVNTGGLIPAAPSRGRDAYTIRVENYSPLLLNGVAVAGVGAKPSEPAKVLLGISLSPRRTFTVPATAESVGRLGLKDGIKVLAADLSGL